MVSLKAPAGGPRWSPASGSGPRQAPPGTGGRLPTTDDGGSRASTQVVSWYSKGTALPRFGWFLATLPATLHSPLGMEKNTVSPSSDEVPIRPVDPTICRGMPRTTPISHKTTILRAQRGSTMRHRRNTVSTSMRTQLWSRGNPPKLESEPSGGCGTLPRNGFYTWRLTDAGEVVPTYAKLRVTMFTGTSSEDLQLVARTGPDTAPSDFVVEAVGGQRYWIAAGFRTGDATAYSQNIASGMIIWGPTPGNDRLASAETIPGTAGSISGSNRFATLERGERGSVLGHSSLWWNYGASATGWHRFRLDEIDGPWVLTVYKEGGDGFGGLEFVRSSHQPEGVESDGIEVIFHAEEGGRYAIRLGARGRDGGGEFTMHWGETEAPVWLKYAARLADGDLDASGTSVQLSGPSSLAFNGRGTALYVASKLGLQVFERDPRTGGLTFVQLMEDDGFEDASLIWDPHRDQLYAHRCGTWRRFAPLDETQREVEDEGTISVSGDPPEASECGTGVFGDVFMDDAGSFVNAVLPSAGRLQVLALDAEGDLRHVQTVEVFGLKRAVISNGGSHVYAVTDSSLLVFRRNANTGRLTQTAYRTSLTWRAEALAISSDGRNLFVFDDNGKRTRVFQLEDDPSNPRELGILPPFWRESWPWDYWNNRCGFARVRKGTLRRGRLLHGYGLWCAMAAGIRFPRGHRPRCSMAGGPLQPSGSRIRSHSKPRHQPRRPARIPGYGGCRDCGLRACGRRSRSVCVAGAILGFVRGADCRSHFEQWLYRNGGRRLQWRSLRRRQFQVAESSDAERRMDGHLRDRNDLGTLRVYADTGGRIPVGGGDPDRRRTRHVFEQHHREGVRANLPLPEFQYAETELCGPVEESFQAWLRAIPSHQDTNRKRSPLKARNIRGADRLRRLTSANWN